MRSKYEIGTKLYWCNYVHLTKEDYKWTISGGEIVECTIDRVVESKDMDGEIKYSYLLKPNGNYEEDSLLKTFSLTKEEAKKRWKEPHKDTIKRKVEEKVSFLKSRILSNEREIEELENLLTTPPNKQTQEGEI